MSPEPMPIPRLNRGALPPFVGEDAAEGVQSPYSVAPSDVVARFGNTEKRRLLWKGFLEYREALRKARLVSGFQWIGGSFVELGGEEPNDIDVVTLYYLPEGQTQADLVAASPDLFGEEAMEKIMDQYSVHAFYLSLSQPLTEYFIERCQYWHSLWGHRRDRRWKGYLRVDL